MQAKVFPGRRTWLQDVQSWLTELGLEKFTSAFAEAEVQFSDLADLTEDDLKEIGLPVGPRRRATSAIKAMRQTGASVAAVASDEPIESTQQGNQLTSPSDAERRHLTVMFVDLVGSTEMATRIDPEDMRNVITNYQNTIAGIVTRYEGFVAKFMGDGVLCYFGWPRANEDDAERAVRAGLAMIAAIKQAKGPNGLTLATRVGIATGVVIVGDLIGSGATQEAAVVGETPNLAARLQGLAEPNQLVLPRETQNLLGDIFELKPLGANDLKGIAAPVEAFVVLGENTRESRFAARQSGTLTPIVGREQELGLIRECWTRTQAVSGQMIIVSGEAGIGKSRITQAAIDEISQDDPVRMTYQCSPYHADSAFYPVIQQMSFAAGFTPSDGLDERLDKLEALLGADHDVLRLVAPMFGLDGTRRYGVLELSPAQQRARTMQVLISLFVKQAEKSPLLLVYEDLHWIDPTSLELLETSLDAIADQKIMILSTTRPTFDYSFGGHPIVTRFALNRLGKDQIEAIVSKLTGAKALPDEIMNIIVHRTDGVPLFVEELTKTILESGALKESDGKLVLDGPLNTIAIPTTLHDSLMARLDRLQPIKEVAHTAACIGRAFDHGLLAQVSPLPEAELSSALDGLIEAELIYRRGLPPEATYLFKHALVRDAAYESLLKEKRRAVHTRILAALESEPDVAPEVLAVHAEAATLTERAIALWEAASKTAIARPAFDEGIAHLHRAIALITPLIEAGDPAATEHALALQVQLSMALLVRVGYGADETIAAFEHALTLAEEIGETPMRYSVLYGLWIGKGIRGEYGEAMKRADALVEQAAKSTETAPVVVANRVAGATNFFVGNLAEADKYLATAIEHYDSVEHAGQESRFGQDIGVSINVFAAHQKLLMGQTRKARAHSDESERIAKSTRHVQTIGYMLMIRALFAIDARDYALVERCVSEVEPIAYEHKLTVWHDFAGLLREILQARNGDAGSFERYLQADAAMIAIETRMFIPQIRIAMGWTALSMGRVPEAANLTHMAQALIDQTGEVYSLSDLHRLKAALALDQGDALAAETSLDMAIEVAREQGAKLWELRAAIDLGRLWQEQGRTDEAIALLEPLHESIEDGDCAEDQVTARALLVALKN